MPAYASSATRGSFAKASEVQSTSRFRRRCNDPAGVMTIVNPLSAPYRRILERSQQWLGQSGFNLRNDSPSNMRRIRNLGFNQRSTWRGTWSRLNTSSSSRIDSGRSARIVQRSAISSPRGARANFNRIALTFLGSMKRSTRHSAIVTIIVGFSDEQRCRFYGETCNVL